MVVLLLLVVLSRTPLAVAAQLGLHAIPLLLARCPASKADVATARDNFFLAASYAARADLTPLFRDALRWPIGADVAAHALEFVLDAARADPTA